MEKTRSTKEKMDKEVFISRQNWHFSFMDDMIKVLFPICTLNWRVDNYVYRQGKGINRRNESTNIIKILAFSVTYSNSKSLLFAFIETFSFIIEEIVNLL